MQTAVYVNNRVPHAALANETPYKALYLKDAHLGHLRAIGARAFVPVETHTNMMEYRAWERRLVGFSVDSKSFRHYNSSTRSVRENKNVLFIETLSVLPEPDLVSGFDEREFTCDDYDDVVRDDRNCTSKSDLRLPAGDDRTVENLSVRDLLDQIHETTDRDLDFDPPSSEPFGDPPVGSPSDTSPG